MRLVAILAGVAASIALAAPASAAPSGPDLAAARASAADPQTVATLGRFFGGTGLAAPSVTLAGDAIAVYTLSPDFVRSGSGAVGQLQYVASTARSGDGRSATVWSIPSRAPATGVCAGCSPRRLAVEGNETQWSVANIASGDDESRFASAAGPGAVLFVEPQINGWYAQRGDRIVPLNDAARGAVGAGVSVAEYQRLVHKKYSDKMPGSAYDRAGKAGGYGGSPSTPEWPLLAGVGALVLGLIAFPRLKRVSA